MLKVLNDILKGNLAKPETILELLRIFLATSALVTALFTFYSKDDRLRSKSENVLVALIFFLLSTVLTIISLSILSVNSEKRLFIITAFIFTSISLVSYLLAFIYLWFSVFLKSYNQIYNLRTDKVWRYFKPVKFFYSLRGYKLYELKKAERKVDSETFKCIRSFFSNEEISLISGGGSILITGEPTEKSVNLMVDFMFERLSKGETINYVSADCHPFEIWVKLKNKYEITESMRKSLVFIDAFTPSFGFTDEIYEDYSKQLESEVKFVRAKTFAGLHSKVAIAFNIIKKAEKKDGRGTRRAMTMIYSNTSALCDFESTEQFKIFWRHVISSERIYGMTLFILEDKLAGEEILNPLIQKVNFVLEFEKDTLDNLKLKRKK